MFTSVEQLFFRFLFSSYIDFLKYVETAPSYSFNHNKKFILKQYQKKKN